MAEQKLCENFRIVENLSSDQAGKKGIFLSFMGYSGWFLFSRPYLCGLSVGTRGLSKKFLAFPGRPRNPRGGGIFFRPEGCNRDLVRKGDFMRQIPPCGDFARKKEKC
jgi:hypothetical protein